ncbi:gluconokinase [Abditibacterium utsteinense]|uniref:Gluconokinase n=1 Tax=Abditibacterium utsteinense TaxID=1960156 RepID=A0A2S8SV33_9BACT|nr:gluconokinase [Abditibacterium utsteinense]PQV64639.1 gluconokinase [Abditibacterium utsteinense]
MFQLIIALDIGTSSTRAIAFDTTGRKVGQAAQISYEQTTSSDGGVEIDAGFLLDLTAKCLEQLLLNLEGEILGVAISCFWHSLLAVDAQGNALTKVLSWADNRAAAYVPLLRARMDEAESHARLGCVFHTSYWPAKLLWLRDNRPELFTQNEVRWMGFGEYLRQKWCNDARMSLSMASGSGLFHQNNADFDEEMLSHLPVTTAQIPDLCDLFDFAFLDEFHKKSWPKLKSAKIFPAIGDGACSNIGSGCADASKIGLNAGTSGALRVVLPDFEGAPPRGLWRYRVDKRRSIVGGALSNAGNVIAWARDNFKLSENWQDAVEQMEIGAHGLTVLPFLAGERAPLWNANARFVLEGASWNTDANSMMRAILEGAALRFSAVAHELLRLAPEAQIVFSGGALEKIPVWSGILCDCVGTNLTQSLESEASARGAALLALEALGILDDAKNAPVASGAELTPNAQNHALYRTMLDAQNALYNKIYA